ncbi:MBL fold metallo-hydrolase [Spiroplasma floricola]|uniref:MBL fold metallo-hydrolase n=1 Tax=Spiroplasma floricola 23-6 TaxID=1336749 RepID=A0A2K8SDT5_9MOLU|nr:MBL fold metallo-hydrolase [Spiroplasma floricola]AUB31624.1 MBL fold metallo-hydrolase [Spiroplasma floricola 23-6]
MIQVFTCRGFKKVNAFLLHNENKKAILFDTGYLVYEDIIKFVEENNIKITDIFITHGHFAHFYGINEICKNQDNPNVFIGKDDLLNLFDSVKNQSEFFEGVGKYILQPIKNLKVIAKDTKIKVNGYNLEIYGKKIHTDGSLLFSVPEKKFIFVGDFIFKDESYLMDDLMNLDEESEKKAKEIFNWFINKFDKNFSVFPGHYEYGFKIRDILEEDEGKLLRKYIEKAS